MPGLTLWLSPEQDTKDLTARFRKAQASMLHSPDFRGAMELEAGGCRVGHVGYWDYPVRFLQSGDFLVGLEGDVPGAIASRVESGLLDLAEIALRGGDEGPEAVRRWILENDGDYLVSIAARDGKRMIVFSDPLGRLPTYVHTGSKGLIIARECKFIATARGVADFDKTGWAQHLWMGYPLGERTLFSGVSRAPGGFYISALSRNGVVECSSKALVTCDFDEKERWGSLSRCASDLADAFVGATGHSVAGRESRLVALSLSGGNDSRSVAAALGRANVSFEAATFRTADTPNGVSWQDARIASRIAQELAIPWRLISLSEPSADDERHLVWMKDGLNYVGMAFILGFLRELAGWGTAGLICVTGDGGDKVLPDIRPGSWIRTSEELRDAVIAEHAVLDASTAEDMTGIARGTLRRHLEDHLGGYPERRLAQKAVHFKVYERGRKWLFEGEDRNRFFFRQASPFYAFSFFQMAMRVPDRFKEGNALYREFQSRLNPSLTRIEHAGTGRVIGTRPSGWGPRLSRAGRYLPMSVKAGLKGILGLEKERVTEPPPAGFALFRARGVAISGRSNMVFEPTLRMIESSSVRQYLDWRTLALLEEVWCGALDA